MTVSFSQTPRANQSRASVLHIPTVSFDSNGSLSYIEQFENVPFEIRRIFYIFDWQNNEVRGRHAHKSLQQYLVPLAGCFTVTVDDGRECEEFHLDRPDRGLLVPPGLWTSIYKSEPGGVLLVVASDYYDEEDYIRDYSQFLSYAKGA